LTRPGSSSILWILKARRAFLFANNTLMNALTTYLKHVRAEFTHIVWPSRQKAISHTLVVVLIAAIITVLVGLLDLVLSGVVGRVVGA
jgi:preprotein translocase SecE subunit